MLNVSDVELAREFYVDALDLPVVEEDPGMFVFRAGAVRFTVVGGGTMVSEDDETDPPATLMFRTPDIESTVAALRSKGVSFHVEIRTAPGFMRFVSLLDPDNNVIYLAGCIRDPLLPVGS